MDTAGRSCVVLAYVQKVNEMISAHTHDDDENDDAAHSLIEHLLIALPAR